MDLLHEMAKLRTNPKTDGFVVPGGKPGNALSTKALLMLLRRMDRGNLTTRGCRSTFREWCAAATNHPREVVEAALAHALRDKTEAAYQRGDRSGDGSPGHTPTWSLRAPPCGAYAADLRGCKTRCK